MILHEQYDLRIQEQEHRLYPRILAEFAEQ